MSATLPVPLPVAQPVATGPAAVPGVVSFDYAGFSEAYPDIGASITPGQAQAYFTQAGLFLDNTAASPVRDATPGGQRAQLLNLLVAHLATLFSTINGQAPSGLIGAITSASEGSVSVSTNAPALMGSAAWFGSTQYGLMFWTATAAYRVGRYYPGPTAGRRMGGGGAWQRLRSLAATS